MEYQMIANTKQLLLIAALVGPTAALAGDNDVLANAQTAANETAVKERSDHSTNKKAIVMEAKEQLRAADVRDWSAIDTNKDHLISPEEMEKYLSGVWAAKPKG